MMENLRRTIKMEITFEKGYKGKKDRKICMTTEKKEP